MDLKVINMKKEAIIKEIELEIKEFNLARKEYNLKLNLGDLIADFFTKRKITPQEEIDERLKFLNYNDVRERSVFQAEYQKLILMRDNPNWKDDIKEQFKNNFKKFIILAIIPVFSLLYVFGFILDEISNKNFTTDLLMNYIQLLIIHLIIPIYIYNPFNRKIWNDQQKYDRVYNAIIGRFVFGGNLLFFTSLITMNIKFYGYNLTNNLIWGDIRCFIIPFCVGFVFFYNSFLKIRKYN